LHSSGFLRDNLGRSNSRSRANVPTVTSTSFDAKVAASFSQLMDIVGESENVFMCLRIYMNMDSILVLAYLKKHIGKEISFTPETESADSKKCLYATADADKQTGTSRLPPCPRFGI
jgi:hypothetical protein